MIGDLPYRSLNNYFKKKYSNRVQKITVSLPLTCPNIDGTKGSGGCIYCFNGSIPPGNSRQIPLSEQINNGIQRGKKKYGLNTKFIIYYQTNSNTYDKYENLKNYYDEALKFSDVIGIDIGTRSDCIDEKILDLINSYTEKLPEVWIEYGLQSANDETLKKINRGHSVEDFVNAVLKTKKTKIKTIAHIIIGFPWETKNDFLKTAKLCADLKIDGIKIHPLYIMKETKLAANYEKEKFKLLELDEYIKILSEIIGLLPENTIIMRFTAEGDKNFLLAPEYCKPEYKNIIKEKLIKYMKENNIKQGMQYK